MAFLKRHFFSITIIILFALMAATSFFRFVVNTDYYVSYEGDCDPAFESCYIGCEDDECTEEYYYSYMERHAAELSTICGNDISECDEAYYCPEDESVYCEITFCEPAEDEECYNEFES